MSVKSKKVIAKKSTPAKQASKKPVREVQKAPLGEVLVTLDRVIAFLDHATTALNANTAELKSLKAEVNRIEISGTPSAREVGAAIAREIVTPTATVVTEVRAATREEAREVNAVIKDARPPVAEVEHTPSYEIVMKKLPLCADHEAVEIIIGQINRSEKLRADEKPDLLARCQARKDIIPF